MAKEQAPIEHQYIIEPSIGEWRTATLDADDVPRNLHYYADAGLSFIDAVYTARVTKVDTALDMAFLDLGGERTGMLNMQRAKQLVKGQVGGISDCVHEGQKLLVQVLADPSVLEPHKSMPVTAKPRMLGRYVVIETGAPRLHFSKDLPPRTLKALTKRLEPLAVGVSIIVRTGAMDIDADAIEAEVKWLMSGLKASEDIGLEFSYTPLEQALLASPEAGEIIIDNAAAYTDARALTYKRWPDLNDRLTQWHEKTPAFDSLGIEEEINEALADQINLPSGGWISIHETPTLTAIDVNVGSAMQGRRPQDAIVETNLEAALAVAHHLRFQDMGGLIVVDFINMSAKGAAGEMMKLLDKALKTDPVPVQHTGISTFGLVEFARKRKGLSLRQRKTVSRGVSDRTQAVALDLIRRSERLGLSADSGKLALSAPLGVLEWLQAHDSMIKQLKAVTHREVTFVEHASTDVNLVK